MNLVCYPHYAAGGLICNILNQPPDSGSHIGSVVSSLEHFLFIGDNHDVYDEFDLMEFENKRQEALKTAPPNKPWLGTHCHPYRINLTNFNQSISITTESFQSRLYRWLRVYNLYFKPQWENYFLLDRNDLMRETAKSYLKPFYKCNRLAGKEQLIEIELQDIVECTPTFKRICQQLTKNPNFGKVDLWLSKNDFLKDYQHRPEYASFMQADYELSTGISYSYE